MNVYIFMVLILLYILTPFILTSLHCRVNKELDYQLALYRYFVILHIWVPGMIASAVILNLHYLDRGHDMLVASILAMVVFSAYALWQKGNIQIAPALVWSFYALGFGFFQFVEVINGVVQYNIRFERVSIVYHLVIFAIFFTLFNRLKKHKAILAE